MAKFEARNSGLDRRAFLQAGLAGAATFGAAGSLDALAGADREPEDAGKPNLVFVFADQWRQQAAGFAGDPNALTPHIDALAKDSLNFTHAVSGCPVCSPYRASLLTGQYWMTHGHFLNDLALPPEAPTFGKVLKEAGYDTGYIGKWHLDGHGRSSFIPRERRQGFDYWKVLECTHDYNRSYYYDDLEERFEWEGYDAFAQTHAAQEFLADRADTGRPFALFLSWGPPHSPYDTAPEEHRQRFDPAALELRPNVPADRHDKARPELAGYYAHLSALDDCVGRLLKTLRETGLEENTVFVLTSDHGDMLHSQGNTNKQQPWDESIRVPFFLRYPKGLGTEPREVPILLNTPDIQPTLLGLCGIQVPRTVEGTDYSGNLRDGTDPEVEAALILCVAPFGQWIRRVGGKEFRGVRTSRYTYCRDLSGPWLFYDNLADPYQMENLAASPKQRDVREYHEDLLRRFLDRTGDDFTAAERTIQRWGYRVDDELTVRYKG